MAARSLFPFLFPLSFPLSSIPPKIHSPPFSLLSSFFFPPFSSIVFLRFSFLYSPFSFFPLSLSLSLSHSRSLFLSLSLSPLFPFYRSSRLTFTSPFALGSLLIAYHSLTRSFLFAIIIPGTLLSAAHSHACTRTLLARSSLLPWRRVLFIRAQQFASLLAAFQSKEKRATADCLREEKEKERRDTRRGKRIGENRREEKRRDETRREDIQEPLTDAVRSVTLTHRSLAITDGGGVGGREKRAVRKRGRRRRPRRPRRRTKVQEWRGGSSTVASTAHEPSRSVRRVTMARRTRPSCQGRQRLRSRGRPRRRS